MAIGYDHPSSFVHDDGHFTGSTIHESDFFAELRKPVVCQLNPAPEGIQSVG